MAQCRLWMTIEPDLKKVRAVAGAVRGLLDQFECTEELAFTVELCVVEAVTNVVQQTRAAPEAGIEVLVTVVRDLIQVSVTDKGTTLPGGCGLDIILSLMDDVTYRAADDRNVLTMSTKLLRRAA